MKRVNMVTNIIRVIFALTCIGANLIGIYMAVTKSQSPSQFFVASITGLVSFGITFIPDFLKNKDIMMMPSLLQLFFTLFLLFAMLFGEVFGFYDLFPWWDTMLHTISGAMFAMVGFVLIASLNRDNSLVSRLNPVMVILFCVCFALTCGAVWEIFEFVGDSLLGMNMQRWQSTLSPEQWSAIQNVSNQSNPGLINTMKDIITDAIGAVLCIFAILPFVRRDNKYVKEKITAQELLQSSEQKIFNPTKNEENEIVRR